MATDLLPADVVKDLHHLFTRAHYSAADYVADAQPFTVAADAPLALAIDAVRAHDRRQATLLANLIQYYELVPEAGTFPWWYRDLNYLSLPYLAGFVLETMDEDLRVYERVLRETPEACRLVHTTLRTIRRERETQRAALAPLVAEARAREAQRYADEAAAIANARLARLAEEKAAAEKARKAAQEGRKLSTLAKELGLEDPAEDGISGKEKARRTMMVKRAQAKAAEEKAAAPVPAADPTAGLPDPNEPGISGKEKAKRTMMIKRAQKQAAAAPAPAADPTAGMPDPNEPGISGKEKAKRTMMIKRAQKQAAAAAPPAAPAADVTADMPDPDEPGISAKEKAKRTMMIKRAQKKAAEPTPSPAAPAPAAPAPAAAADPAADLPDPNEEGISSKEKAKRTMMIKRAQKKAAEES